MTSVIPKASSNRYPRTSLLPRSNVPRVLLHDNCSQQHLLDLTLSHLSVQQHRTRRHLELRRRTFLTTQSLKQENLSARGVRHVSIVPTGVAQAYSKMTRFYQHNVKRLPPSAHLQEARCVDSTPVDVQTPGGTPEEVFMSDRVRELTVGAIHSSPPLPTIPNVVQRSHTVYRDPIRHSTPKTGPQGGTDRPIRLYRPPIISTTRERATTTYKCPPTMRRSGAFTDYRSETGTRNKAGLRFRPPNIRTPNAERPTTFRRPPGTPGPQSQRKEVKSGGSKTPYPRTPYATRTNKTPEAYHKTPEAYHKTPEAYRQTPEAYHKIPYKQQAGSHQPPAPRTSSTRHKLAWARPKMATRLLQDPRFTGLKQHLQSPDPTRYTDSFLHLSDAGNTVLQHHHTSLAAWQQEQTGGRLVEVVETVKPARRASVFHGELTDSLNSMHYTSGSDTEDEGDTPDLC